MIFGNSGNDTPAVMKKSGVGIVVLLVRRFERGSVKLFIEVLKALVCNTVETAINLVEQPILSENRHSLTGIVARWAAKVIYGGRGQIAMRADKLQNAIVDWSHPISLFPHSIITASCYTHRTTGMRP